MIALNDIASKAVSGLVKRTMLCLALNADSCGVEGQNMGQIGHITLSAHRDIYIYIYVVVDATVS